MSIKFHVNRHGVPAVCNVAVVDCPYGKELHFRTYEDAELHIEKVNQEYKLKLAKDDNPIKKIKSYFDSLSAINEFPINKSIATINDFELIAVSWLSRLEVQENMKSNRIGSAKFSYGDIVRILEEKLKRESGSGLNLEKYYNPVPFDFWEDKTTVQWNLYKDTSELEEFLGFESMQIISLPIKAREILAEGGYIRNPESIHEVIYRTIPAASEKGDVIVYNHNTKQIYEEFDIYEVAGAFEGKSLYDLCYGENLESKFESLWNFNNQDNFSYDEAVDRYRREQFFKGLEGVDIPRAFVEMSPIVAQEIVKFVRNYRAIMLAVDDILEKQGLQKEYKPEFEVDDGDWILEYES